MASETLTLPPDLAAKIEERIESGEASSAVEVVRAGLAALDAADVAKLDALREKIARAVDDPRPGTPMDESFDRVEALLRDFTQR